MQLTPPLELVGAERRATRINALLIVLALVAPFAWYFATASSIVDIWNSSETFAHGYIILPISLWLIWRRRASFVRTPPAPWWPGLALIGIAGAAWMASRLGQVQVVSQYAFVAMVIAGAVVMLGRELASALAFPLLFLLFAVPFGEIFIGPLISFTADFTVAAVQATGIPVLRNGTRFELPTGSWSVVEACSGVRYLISSVTIGCLYAYLTYRSLPRRLAFIALSVVVPVIANGLRAFMIVMIGHYSGMTLAVGVDHIIYGWLFFGLVMFLMFWIGSFWRDDIAPEKAADAVPLRPVTAPARMAAAACAVLAMSAVWPAATALLARANASAVPVVLPALASSWSPAPAFTDWAPQYMEPSAQRQTVLRSDSGAPVAFSVLYYRNQTHEKALISSVNIFAHHKSVYFERERHQRTETIAGAQVALRESVIQTPSGNLLAWHWNWIDGQDTVNDYLGKLRQAQAQLLMHGDDAALVMATTPLGEHPDEARAVLRAFLAAHRPAIGAMLADVRRSR